MSARVFVIPFTQLLSDSKRKNYAKVWKNFWKIYENVYLSLNCTFILLSYAVSPYSVHYSRIKEWKLIILFFLSTACLKTVRLYRKLYDTLLLLLFDIHFHTCYWEKKFYSKICLCLFNLCKKWNFTRFHMLFIPFMFTVFANQGIKLKKKNSLQLHFWELCWRKIHVVWVYTLLLLLFWYSLQHVFTMREKNFKTLIWFYLLNLYKTVYKCCFLCC